MEYGNIMIAISIFQWIYLYQLDHWFLLYVLCPFIWLVSPVWDAAKLTLRGWLHLFVHGLRPYWFKSNYCCCSQTNAWKLRIHSQRRLSAFCNLSLKLTCCCYQLLVKLRIKHYLVTLKILMYFFKILIFKHNNFIIVNLIFQ